MLANKKDDMFLEVPVQSLDDTVVNQLTASGTSIGGSGLAGVSRLVLLLLFSSSTAIVNNYLPLGCTPCFHHPTVPFHQFDASLTLPS